MADGGALTTSSQSQLSLLLLSPSGCASEARPSPGPLNHPHPPEWKGMGPRRCHCRSSRCHHPHHHHHQLRQHQPSRITTLTSTSSSTITSSLLLLHQPRRHILLLFTLFSLVWASVSAFSLQPTSQCQIDQCWEQYTEAKDALGGAGDGNPLGEGGSAGQSGAGDGGGGRAGGGLLDNEAHCVALRTYLNCIKGTKNSSRGCLGNIHYYSVRNGVRNQMKQYNCTMNGPTLEVPPASGSQAQPLSPPPRQVPARCQFQGGSGAFRHCGLFGDPHLRTFTDQFQTCKVKGAWPLVNNDYLTVQVTNDPVLGGSGDATATSKLTVIVKSHPDCGSAHYHTYQAQTDSLPGAFEDGNTSFGPYGSVFVKEVEPNRHVEIHVLYVSTTIIVRQIGRYFTFAIHTPEELVNGSGGQHSHEPELCSKGCPPSEQINYKQYLAQRRDRLEHLRNEETESPSGRRQTISRLEAEEMCRQTGLVDFYFDSCVFDLLATGDKNFTLAALGALKDVLRLDPDKAVQSSRSTLEPYDEMVSSSASAAVSLLQVSWRTVSLWWCVVCIASVWLTLWSSPVAMMRVR